MNRRHALGLIGSLAAWPALAAEEPKPESDLAALLGEWRGTLTYRDQGAPDRIVTLPTRLFVSLIGPDELALHLVHDDGPGKTVYGYERLRFEFASQTLVWISGAIERTALVGRIVSSASDGGLRRYVVDTSKDRTLTRFTFEFGSRAFSFRRDEIDAAGQATNRSRYAFTRPA